MSNTLTKPHRAAGVPIPATDLTRWGTETLRERERQLCAQLDEAKAAYLVTMREMTRLGDLLSATRKELGPRLLLANLKPT
jgi:hypothetical protein